MKLKLFLIAVSCFYIAPFCSAQSDDVLPTNEEMFILDGNKTYYAYGRYLTSNQIAIGLTEEGVYELRNDSVVWLVNQPGSEDRAIVTIRKEKATGNLLFLIREGTDTIGIYNPERNEIFNKKFDLIASIVTSDNRIISNQAETLLYIHLPSVNEHLAVFFFLYHYLPNKTTRNNLSDL